MLISGLYTHVLCVHRHTHTHTHKTKKNATPDQLVVEFQPLKEVAPTAPQLGGTNAKNNSRG